MVFWRRSFVLSFRAWFVLMETSSGRTPSMPWFPATPSSSWTPCSSWLRGWTTLGCLMLKLASFAQWSLLHLVCELLYFILVRNTCYSIKTCWLQFFLSFWRICWFGRYFKLRSFCWNWLTYFILLRILIRLLFEKKILSNNIFFYP